MAHVKLQYGISAYHHVQSSFCRKFSEIWKAAHLNSARRATCGKAAEIVLPWPREANLALLPQYSNSGSQTPAAAQALEIAVEAVSIGLH